MEEQLGWVVCLLLHFSHEIGFIESIVISAATTQKVNPFDVSLEHDDGYRWALSVVTIDIFLNNSIVNR